MSCKSPNLHRLGPLRVGFALYSGPGLVSLGFCETPLSRIRNILRQKGFFVLNQASSSPDSACSAPTFHKTWAHDETARTHSARASVPAPAVGEALSVLAPVATACGAVGSAPGR